VLAEGNGANLTVFYEAYDFTFGKGVLLTAYLNVADVAWYAEGYEYHEVVPVEERLAFSCNGLDGNPLKQG
jgi:hypothetical protein